MRAASFLLAPTAFSEPSITERKRPFGNQFHPPLKIILYFSEKMVEKAFTQRDWTHDYFLAPIGQLTFHVSRKDLFSVPEPTDYTWKIQQRPLSRAVVHSTFTQGLYDLYDLLL